MKPKDYLSRINHAGPLRPTPEVLSALQEAHLLAVPFENLDIHIGKEIVLDLPRLFAKIVVTKRGGFCYELNGLFHWLLGELGFDARLVMGRVYDRDRSEFGPDFDHMLILARTGEKKWVVDVGFGDFSMHPLELTLDQPLADTNGLFLIERQDSEFSRVSRFSREAGTYIPEYLFSEKERRLEEFSAMCLYHQTSPESHFTRNSVCSIATKTGRVTLTSTKLLVTNGVTRLEFIIRNEAEFTRALQQHFGITLPAST